MTIKVLLTGASGQLGQTLQQSVPFQVELFPLSRSELNLSDSDACRQAVFKVKPNWVINAGAFTAVDKAETEKDLAYAVNEGAPKAFASALSDIGGRLLQISTDFVFSGNQGFPYNVNDPVDPISVYGSSKAAGEIAALTCPGSCVLRTSWLYSHLGKNFCLTMLRMHASKASLGEVLNVVADQVGCPTSTYNLSSACWRIISREKFLNKNNIFHWSDAGVASWYDFAFAIGELGVANGLLEESATIAPIGTDKYPTPAKRPSYSILDCRETMKILNLDQVHWRTSLNYVLSQMSQKLF